MNASMTVWILTGLRDAPAANYGTYFRRGIKSRRYRLSGDLAWAGRERASRPACWV